tara:strand:+ start:1492 stop:3234 length:1743 start_codon:yes stop_codon:yes gene_type:complete
MAASVNPNGDPYRGGSFTGTTVPNVNGSINPASVSGSVLGGVSPGQPMLARNDRGSNISIPYARVVFHPSERTALPAVTEAKTALTTLGKPGGDMLVETENLYSGRLAFVLGRRGAGYDAGISNIVGFDAMTFMGGGNVNSRHAGFLAHFAVGGSDVNTAQRLCSFEYLKRYFHHVLRKKVVDIGDGSTFADKQALVNAGYGEYYKIGGAALAAIKVTDVDTDVLLDGAGSVRQAYGGNDPTLAGLIAKAPHSGLFMYDNGPFLRGKNLDHRVLSLRSGPHNKRVSFALGDNLAFNELQRLIMATGACDWTPDGVVLSRLSQGDKLMDDELDSRDGQLYNITIGGPAVTSSWTGDYHREVMPLDKVFIVIVADVWYNPATVGAPPGPPFGQMHVALANASHDDYEAAKKTVAGANRLGADGRDANAIRPLVRSTDRTARMTNMRVRLATSSEMINCSNLKSGKHNVDSVDPTSRMGLMISGNATGNAGVAEYIIGGWCIGTVIDASASRALPNGGNLMGTAKRAKSSVSCNVAVNVHWWSADKMYRHYMNRDGTNRARYDSSKGLPVNASRPAGQRGAAP